MTRTWMTLMPKLRPLPGLVIAVTLSALPAATLAQDQDVETSASPVATFAVEDGRLAALENLFPTVVAGLPLGEHQQLVTGEELAAVMSPEESAVLAELLEDGGKTIADYAAASSWASSTGNDIVVLQAHRIDGIEASDTIASWVEIVTLTLAEPTITDASIAGRPVTTVADASTAESPQLYIFSARDVIWMVVADEAIVAELMEAVDADIGEVADVGDAAATEAPRSPEARPSDSSRRPVSPADAQAFGTLARR